MKNTRTKTVVEHIYIEHLANEERLIRSFAAGYQWPRARLHAIIRHARQYGYIEREGNLLYATRKGLKYIGIIKPLSAINKPKASAANQWLYQTHSAASATPAGSVFNTRNRHAFNLTPQCAPRTAGTGRLAHDTCYTQHHEANA